MDTVLDTEYAPVRPIETPPHIPGFLQVARNVLSPEECAAIIRIAEERGFVAASLWTDLDGYEHFSDRRKSARCIIDSTAFAARLWERIRNLVPSRWGNAMCTGLNERLRLLRYDVGDEFKPHQDGSYHGPTGAISKITVLIYLNVGYEGGFTHFLHDDGSSWFAVEPTVGAVAMQDQALVHGVPPIITGRKYAMRTEVMYMPEYQQGAEKVLTIRE